MPTLASQGSAAAMPPGSAAGPGVPMGEPSTPGGRSLGLMPLLTPSVPVNIESAVPAGAPPLRASGRWGGHQAARRATPSPLAAPATGTPAAAARASPRVAKAASVFGGHQFLDDAIAEVVSAPLPVVGNTVRLTADAFNLTGTLDLVLEGSVLGQFWEDIPLTFTSPTAWGASTSASVAVTDAMVRVRATLSQSNGDKTWFEVGIAFTDQ